MATLASQPQLKHTSVTVADCRDPEAGPPPQSAVRPPFPKWPRTLGAALNIFVLLASVSVISILAHSLHEYSSTRDIHFGGTAISWPNDLNLHPDYLIIAASAMSLAPSLIATFLSLRRLKVPSYSTMEKIQALGSAVLLIVWIVADSVQGISGKTPRTDLLSWACRRRDSPTNVLVSYTSICDEQVTGFLPPSADRFLISCSVLSSTWLFLSLLQKQAPSSAVP